MEESGFRLVAGGGSLILLGLALRVALRLLRSAQRPGRDDDVATLLLVGAWATIIVGAMAVVAGILGGSNPLGLVACIAIYVILAIAAQFLLEHFRRSRQQMLLWSLATAAERNMPLESAIEAFAADCRASPGARIRDLARLLKAGWSLPDALEKLPGLVPRESLMTIRLGHESGALAAALREAVELRPQRERLWRDTSGRFMYLFMVVLFGTMFTTFMALKIFPMFQRIFADFGVALPPLTTATFDAFYALAPYGFMIALAFPFAFFWLIAAHARGTGWTLIYPRRLLRRLDTAAILDGLATVAAHQRPLVQAIAVLAGRYPKWSIRRRLRKVLRSVNAGGDPLETLAAKGLLGRADLAVLQAAQRVGNLAWAIREMADGNRRRLVYRLQILGQILFPLAILVLGTMVAVFVISCFFPLVTLIQSLV